MQEVSLESTSHLKIFKETLMKKMYSAKSKINTDSVDTATKNNSDEKKTKALEESVRRLSEQVAKLAAAQQLNSRQIRRQNTDIHNVNTVLRNR